MHLQRRTSHRYASRRQLQDSPIAYASWSPFRALHQRLPVLLGWTATSLFHPPDREEDKNRGNLFRYSHVVWGLSLGHHDGRFPLPLADIINMSPYIPVSL
jgi:hypothetical protein